jgi:hypothetical protein
VELRRPERRSGTEEGCGGGGGDDGCSAAKKKEEVNKKDEEVRIGDSDAELEVAEARLSSVSVVATNSSATASFICDASDVVTTTDADYALLRTCAGKYAVAHDALVTRGSRGRAGRHTRRRSMEGGGEGTGSRQWRSRGGGEHRSCGGRRRAVGTPTLAAGRRSQVYRGGTVWLHDAAGIGLVLVLSGKESRGGGR